MSAPGAIVGPGHLSAEVAALREPGAPLPVRSGARTGTTLSKAVEDLEREMVRDALDRCSGNISETARQLGLTRRGLYLKLRRLGFEARSDVDMR